MKYAPRKVYIKESGRYVELSYTDFCRRRESDQTYMDKLFIPIQGCLLEVVREQYADFYRDRERWRYLQKLDARNSLLSLDGFTDSEGNPLDFIADEAADIAETVVNAVMVDRLTDYDALAAKTTAAVDRAHALAGELQTTEAALSKVSGLMGAVVDYARARPVFDGYKAARYSKKYLAEHEAELATYRAARAAMNELLGGEKLPKMDALKKQRRELADKKKALYAEYRQAQRDMREAVAVKANIDHLLGLTDGRDDKEQTR